MHKRIITVSVLILVVVWLASNEGVTLDLKTIAKDKASKAGFDWRLIFAIIKVESNFKVFAVNTNTNGSRDYGLMQVNERNLQFVNQTATSIFNPESNIDSGVKLLADARQSLGDTLTTQRLISAYNQGAPKTLRDGIRNFAYVAKVSLWYFVYKLKEKP